jgi:enamine deaminase RidA (YjgF/YER057c/UK114 family)
LSALYAAEDNGAMAAAVGSAGLRYLGAPVQHQMRAILDAAGAICQSSGTSLDNVTRAHHFVNDLNAIYPALRIWQEKLDGAPVPFAAVRMPSPMLVPGCDIIVDIWAYQSK